MQKIVILAIGYRSSKITISDLPWYAIRPATNFPFLVFYIILQKFVDTLLTPNNYHSFLSFMCEKIAAKKPAKLATMYVCIDTLQIPKRKYNKKKLFHRYTYTKFHRQWKNISKRKKKNKRHTLCDYENVIKKI